MGFTGNHFYEVTAFEDPELLSLPENFIPDALSTCPDLVPFTHYLENTLCMKAHTLSRERRSTVIPDYGSGQHLPIYIFICLINADIQFEKVSLTKTVMKSIFPTVVLSPFLKAPTEICAVRSFSLITIPLTSIRIPAAIFAANLKKELFYTKARHYTLHGGPPVAEQYSDSRL